MKYIAHRNNFRIEKAQAFMIDVYAWINSPVFTDIPLVSAFPFCISYAVDFCALFFPFIRFNFLNF